MTWNCIYRRLVLIALALFISLVSACGLGGGASVSEQPIPASAPEIQQSAAPVVIPQTTSSPKEQTGFLYVPEWEDLELDGTPERLFYLDDKLFLEVRINSGEAGVYDLSRRGLILPQGIAGKVLAAAPGEDAIWYCWQGEDGLCVTGSDASGKTTGTVSLQDTGGIYPYTMAVDGDGCFYLLGGDWLRVFSLSGKQVANFPLGAEKGIQLTRISSGQVLLTSQTSAESGTEGAVKLLNTESIGASLTEKRMSYRVYPGWNDGALLSDGGSLYALEMQDQTMNAVLDWIDTDINPETLVSAAAADPEQIYVVTTDQTGTRLGTLHRETAEKDTGTVIQVGLYLEETELNSAVNGETVAFNLGENNFRVHLVNYRNYTDGQSRLLQDAEDLDLVLAEPEVLRQMELQDLGKQFNETLGEADILPWVYQCMNTGKRVELLPLYFQVETLVGNSGIVGSEAGWGPAEFRTILEQNRSAAVEPVSNAYDVLDGIVKNVGVHITDYASLLCAVREIPVDDETLYTYPANLSGDIVKTLLNGQLLLEPATISSFSNLLAWRAAMGEELVWKGYPSDDGNGSVLVLSESECFGIPKKANHTAEAWTYLSSLLKGSGLTQFIQERGFPITEEAFRRMEEEAMAGLSYTDASGKRQTTGGTVFLLGNAYDVDPLTEEQAVDFREWLMDICPESPEENAGIADQARTALRAVLEKGAEPEIAAKAIR